MQPSKKIKQEHPTISQLISYLKNKKLTTMKAIADHFEISRPTLYSIIDSYGKMSRDTFKESISQELGLRTIDEFREFIKGGYCLEVYHAGVQFFIHDDFDVYRATKSGFKKAQVEYRKDMGNDATIIFIGRDGKRKSVQKIRLYYMATHRKAIPKGYKVVKVNPNSAKYTEENLALVPVKDRKRSDVSQLMVECEQLWKQGHCDLATSKFQEFMMKRVRES